MQTSGEDATASSHGGDADQVQRWGAAQERAYLAELELTATTRDTERLGAATKAAELRSASIHSSRWWRATAPVRVPVNRVRHRPSQPVATPAKAISPTRSDSQVQAYCTQRIDSLRDRLHQALAVLGDADATDGSLAGLLIAVAERVDADASPQLLWLLHVVFTSELPTNADIDLLRARFEIGQGPMVVHGLLQRSAHQPDTWATTAPIELVSVPVIETTNSATNTFHTGIERVARTTVPLWLANHTAELAVFDKATRTLRPPSPTEAHRVLQWGRPAPAPTGRFVPDRILVPWQTTVVLPELAGMAERAARLAALASWSGNDLSAILFDLIPYTLPESARGDLPRRFGNYIAAIRRGKRLSSISQSVADDFTSFAIGFTNQNIAAPEVRADVLPFDAGQVPPSTVDEYRDRVLGESALPLVLSVSSIEPRKNHLRTLRAAERLWRQGHQFQLLFIAGHGWKREAFDAEFARLVERGRPVRLIDSASEDLLWSAYRLATFSVFISIAEGFGLPAAESIAAGTPVVLTRNGPMGEIGSGGGAVLVDPFDVDDIAAAMHRLLIDEAFRAGVAADARSRPLPSWDTYADRTWKWLVDGER